MTRVDDEQLWSWVDCNAAELDGYLREHPEDRGRVDELRRAGLELHMLSGDTHAAAAAVAGDAFRASWSGGEPFHSRQQGWFGIRWRSRRLAACCRCRPQAIVDRLREGCFLPWEGGRGATTAALRQLGQARDRPWTRRTPSRLRLQPPHGAA